MRIGFIGCVDFSRTILAALIASGVGDVVGVVTKAKSSVNSDFCDLAPMAAEHGIPVLHQAGADQARVPEFFAALAPDVIFCVGWPNLLKDALFEIPRYGVIGYHPADLPRNRGRHPIIWALALGLTETASTFFQIDGGVDSGPIASKVIVPIHADDDAAALYERLRGHAVEQVVAIARACADDTLVLAPQDLTTGNIWRKRGKIDGRIDWRMPAAAIHDLVRALRPPYPGAYFERRSGDETLDLPVGLVRVVSCVLDHLEPGRVLDVKDGVVVVKAGIDAVELIEHGMPDMPVEGDYL